jgi:two-component system chemotaxis response regulator CheB
MSGYDIVAIGASWGGLHAIGTVLEGIGPGFGAPIVVAQHRSPSDEKGLLGELLARRSGIPVADGEDKDALIPGRVILAPAGYHLLVEDGCVELSCEDLVQFSRPSIDVLFESVADAYGSRAVGVVLTGSNADGAAGLAEIARRGGHTIVQDPATSERPEMPRAALKAVTPDAVLPLDGIAAHLHSLVPEIA